jgi:NitT/TauT family transport system ATP-binding protein
MLQLAGVAKRFVSAGGAAIDALLPIDLTVDAGEFVSIIGPSGCGKSTLLRLVAGLESPSAGRIDWSGVRSDRDIGFVFQEPVLLPWLNAIANVRFPLDAFGVKREPADAQARALLELVGLAGFENALPRELSGGMRQRVAIARALSYDPKLLLMDEPFGALDLLTRDRLNDELAAIWAKTGKTILFVTHSVEEAAYLSDRVVVMSARPGALKRIVSVELPRPRGESTKLDPAFHRLMAELRADLR